MLEVKVGGLIPDKNTGSHVLLLKIPASNRYLPVWIGAFEANAIASLLRGDKVERPLTHDLLLHTIEGLGATISRVVINSMEGGTFFAKLYLTRGHEIVSIDARPSDSIALALRSSSPIFLNESILKSQEGQLYELEEVEGEQGNVQGIEIHSQDAITPEFSSESLEDLLRKVEKGEISPPRPSAEDEQEDEEKS